MPAVLSYGCGYGYGYGYGYGETVRSPYDRGQVRRAQAVAAAQHRHHEADREVPVPDDGVDGAVERVELAEGLGEQVRDRDGAGLELGLGEQLVKGVVLDVGQRLEGREVEVVETDHEDVPPHERLRGSDGRTSTGARGTASRRPHAVHGGDGRFSPFKKAMQKVGSEVVNKAAGTDLPDAASGFRAYSKASLLRLNVVTQFSYCMETIIQAGNKRLRIESLPITTNPKTRESRLSRTSGSTCSSREPRSPAPT
ncbi:hypothetical protein [Georgenia sp. SUBG003]|uniref:hypothetical protein n=1 Tax=Georgenia sp. SUBG003 TaxID=1497974 RepID=UPI003AB6B60C